MIRTIKICFFLLVVSTINGQVKDSVNLASAIDSLAMLQPIDSSYNATKDYPDNDGILDSLRIDSLPKPKMISIERALLDSLLRPYYHIEIDSGKGNTLGRDIVITPRYRMVIDERSEDTTYVSIPKKIEHFSRMKTYGIDTIGFSNAIELVSIKNRKMAMEPVWWRHKNSIGFDLNEVAFVNWNAGGV